MTSMAFRERTRPPRGYNFIRLTLLRDALLKPQLSISIVSHRHGPLVAELLEDFDRLRIPAMEVLLTVNVPDTSEPALAHRGFPVKILRNASPKGFSANHNAAFRQSGGKFFCVLNPDVRLREDPFPALLHCFSNPEVGVAGPAVLSPEGIVEASARVFPTPLTILAKALGRRDIPAEIPDWVAGMCMVFPRDVFERIGGFDERYFLYYEDIDICARLKNKGMRVCYRTDAHIEHAAQRTSHRELRYFGLHVRSMLIYFWRRYIRR